MEDGRLTDAQGRTVDFKNTVIIMTSNVGARTITNDRPVGFMTSTGRQKAEERRKDYTRMKSKVTDELKKAFSPEFLNRVDDTVVFHSLTREQIEQIVDLELRNVRDQLKRKGLVLELSEKLLEMLSEKGYDPDMGARPLRRAVRQYVEDPVALHLLHDEREQYEGVVRIDLDEDGEVEVDIIEEQLTIKPLKPTS